MRYVTPFSLSRLLGVTVALYVAGGVPGWRSPVLAQAPPVVSSGREEVRVSHILVATKDEAEAIRKEILGQGGDKQSFIVAARKHSKDVTTKLLGGDVGWFRQGGQMERAFTDSAYSLKLGETSEPVQTPFGWHILFLADRREIGSNVDKTPEETTPPKTPPAPVASDSPPIAIANPTPAPDPGALVPTATPTPTAIPAPTPAVEAPPKPVVEAKRTPRSEQMSFRLSIETVKAQSLQLQQNTFTPEQALEINLALKNESTKEQKFFAKELLAMGFKVTAIGEQIPIVGDFASAPEPASYFVTLRSNEITGMEVSLSDYWKGLSPRRYTMAWDVNTLLANVEARFPKIKAEADYTALSEAMKKRFPLTVDMVYRDMSPRILYQRNRPLGVSIFEPIRPDGKYYAQIKLAGGGDPLVIRLDVDKQFAAVRHFVSLVMDGFYDGLDFFDAEEGDFLLGGCPTRNGTGAPSANLPSMRNEAKIEHKRGTVSFVSRNVRSRGPIRGGQVGSIFVVCLKPHPEWNDEHVPFGEVTSGLEQLEKQSARSFREITILTEDQLTNKPKASPTTQPLAGNPEALIKTSKGTLTVELFEDVARNTVANFVTLAEQKFYDKLSQGDGKQQVFVMKDDAGKPFLLQTGSPTNDLDPSAGPGYAIPGEINARNHLKGSLAMCVAYDEASKSHVQDTAGSQFFICLQALPYYDYMKAFTIFGQVTGGMDVLEKLTDTDKIESIEITKKKSHPYTVRKVTSP